MSFPFWRVANWLRFQTILKTCLILLYVILITAQGFFLTHFHWISLGFRLLKGTVLHPNPVLKVNIKHIQIDFIYIWQLKCIYMYSYDKTGLDIIQVLLNLLLFELVRVEKKRSRALLGWFHLSIHLLLLREINLTRVKTSQFWENR